MADATDRTDMASLAVFGVGRTGAVTAVGLATLGHRVLGLDTDAARVAALAGGHLPEAEPGLGDALAGALSGGRLSFAVANERAHGFDGAFLCVDTPLGEGGSPDLTQVFGAAVAAAPLLRPGAFLVTRSTVPVGTGDQLEQHLAAAGRPDVDVVSVPEFLREGRAWDDFVQPDRVVIGAESEEAAQQVAALFARLERPAFITSRRTAEIAKYAANAFLATSVSFANELSDVCDALGADAATVFDVLRADSRIGPRAYLRPGLGYGGHCLPKDTAALDLAASQSGAGMTQLRATRAVNSERVERTLRWLDAVLDGLPGRVVCIAGLAFKPGTDDLRESPSLRLAAALAAAGATVRGWDPLLAADLPGVTVAGTIVDALAGASALVIANPWPGIEHLKPETLATGMRQPVVFDAPATLDRERWRAAGWVCNGSSPRPPA